MRVHRLALLLPLLAACATIAPPGAPAPPGEGFSHADLDRVLSRFVDERGRVDYAALARDRADLDAYAAQLAAVSPDSDPERFPTTDHRLAYWINAYNAAVLVLVLDHYPVSSVRDVRPPWPLFFVPRLAGFFVLHRVPLGGRPLHLYELENRIVRGRFDEPRIHFALNCASRGCPRLPRRAFPVRGLDAALEREARRFFADPEKLQIDAAAGEIRVSAILDWFEDDFLDGLEAGVPDREPSLLDYVRRYLEPEAAARLDGARAAGAELVFLEYDWRLNDAGSSETLRR